ncbi:MAG: 3-deoxy-D-manno-octulosonic acid transferase, partial [Bacteroidota bacterium]
YMISGDTRFDRVRQLAESSPERPLINAFCNDHEVIIAGSTWPADEELLCSYINNQPAPHSKFIIVPHEIHPSGIKQLEEMLQVTSIRYSQLSKEISTEQIRVLIIDNIGMLSSLYKYGSIAYIGGGFGKGIHNTLEAATYGLPVLFGPKYKKFLEAVELVAIKAAFPVNNSSEITQTIEALRQDNDKRKTASQSAKGYVQSRSGAIKKITTHI